MNKKTIIISVVFITCLLFISSSSVMGRPTGYQSTIDYVTQSPSTGSDSSDPLPPSILRNVFIKDVSIGINNKDGPWVSVKIRNTFITQKTVNVKLYVGEFTSDDYGAEDHTLLDLNRQIAIKGLQSETMSSIVNLNTSLDWQPVVVIVIVTDANTGECYDGKMGFGIYFINLGMGLMYPTLFDLPSEDFDDLGVEVQVIGAPAVGNVYNSVIH